MLFQKINDTTIPFKIYYKLDRLTIEHCENVANYAYLLYDLALKKGLYPDELSEDRLYYIKSSVIYHDIGKSMLPSRLLNKKKALTVENRKLIEKHVMYGLKIFSNFMQPYCNDQSINKIFRQNAVESIMHHHEKFDGSGYPNQLKGDEISALGRICTLADYYDALTSVRPYRMALPHELVISDIKAQSGKIFDPDLVDLFMENNELFKAKIQSKAKSYLVAR